ncbi:MAG: hypothetical protein CMP09_02820 [Yangia sp.]|nr:hypothetical protein [Salipiger sp.]
MPDPVTDGWPLLHETGVPLLYEDGTPILMSAQWLCVFGDEPPSETLRGMTFTKSFSVWVMP